MLVYGSVCVSARTRRKKTMEFMLMARKQAHFYILCNYFKCIIIIIASD